MRVPSEAGLVTFQDWTVRVRPATQGPARLLLLVHGWTGDENSMWVFVRNFAADYWVIAPRAPFPTDPGGYSWRPMPAVTHDRPTLQDLVPAVNLLMPFVDEYARANSLDATQFGAIGFSQGAALVSAMLLLHAERIDRAGILAGFVPAGAEALTDGSPLKGKRIFVAHGRLDKTVPIEHARQSVQLLERAGANVIFCEDDIGHKLSAQCLRALEQFFA